MTPDEDWHDLLFAVRRSLRYHRRRERFFDLYGRWTSGLNVFFGSTATASILGALGDRLAKLGGGISAVIVVALSTIDLIVGSSSAARRHSDLARRFIELEAELTLVESPSEKDTKLFGAKRLAIEADEPPIMRTLDVLCHNELAKASGQEDEIYRVGWVRRRLAQLINLDTTGLKKAGG